MQKVGGGRLNQLNRSSISINSDRAVPDQFSAEQARQKSERMIPESELTHSTIEMHESDYEEQKTRQGAHNGKQKIIKEPLNMAVSPSKYKRPMNSAMDSHLYQGEQSGGTEMYSVWYCGNLGSSYQHRISKLHLFGSSMRRVVKIKSGWKHIFVLDGEGALWFAKEKDVLYASEHPHNAHSHFFQLNIGVSRITISDFDIAKNCLILSTSDGKLSVGNVDKITHSFNAPKLTAVTSPERALKKTNSSIGLTDDAPAAPISQLPLGGEYKLQNPFREEQKDLHLDEFKKGERIDFPLKIVPLSSTQIITKVACGNAHSLLLTNAGFVFSFGIGADGRLGHSDYEDLIEPKMIYTLMGLRVTQIACGRAHNLLLGKPRNKTSNAAFQFIGTTDKQVLTLLNPQKTLIYSWGCGSDGRLGLGDYESRSTPSLIDSILEFEFNSIACGYLHSALLDKSGGVYTFGYGDYGQLGHGNEIKQCRPLKVHALKDQRVVKLSAGGFHTMALTEAGSLFSWGLANHGQLGIAKFLDKNFVSTPVRIDQRTYEISGLQSVNIEDITSASDKSFIVVNHHRKNHLTLFESSEADQPEDVEADEIDEKEESKEETPSTITAGQTTEWGGTDYEDLVKFIAMSGSGGDTPIDRELFSQLSLKLSYRPPNLPQRNKEEQELHLRLVEENRRMYLRRLRQREKEMEEKRKKGEERKQHLSKLGVIWERDVLPQWNRVRHSKKVRQLWIEGIPPGVRGKVWMLQLGNPFCLTEQMYKISCAKASQLRSLLQRRREVDYLLSQHRQASFSTRSKQTDENGGEENFESLEVQNLRAEQEKVLYSISLIVQKDSMVHHIGLIDIDIPRTFPQLGIFKEGTAFNLQLQNVLQSFAMTRPDIGYVQGMSYIAGNLLLYTDQLRAYILFHGLVCNFSLMPFYQMDESQMSHRYQLFKQIFQKNMPQLCEHFQLESVLPKTYLFEWFITLFTRALDINLVGRVWDLFILDGHLILYQTAIAILKCLQKELINADFEGIQKILKTNAKMLEDEDKFIDIIYDVRFPEWVLVELNQLQDAYIP